MKLWKTITYDADLAREIGAACALPFPVAAALAGRGLVDTAAVKNYLTPKLVQLSDPFGLPGVAAASALIWSAIQEHQSIVVYGDYDVDGVTSTTLMARVLQELGGNVRTFLPHRLDDGYGLGLAAVQRCFEDAKPQLLITVDCGTGSGAAVRWLQERGVKVVVTDHHECHGELAPADALVNPKCTGEGSALAILAGVGVAFKVCHGLLKMAKNNSWFVGEKVDLREYLDLVALGTICDVVPLVGENRVLARYGMERMNITRWPGLLALLEVVGIKKEIDSYHLAFQLGPRLNAAGRIGDANRALALLMTNDTNEAAQLAQEMDATNRQRQAVELAMVAEAQAEIKKDFEEGKTAAVVVAKQGWHPGVAGIAAARLANSLYRPVVVIALDNDGRGRGSGRCPDGFNLLDSLSKCSSCLERWGGHSMAAGVEIREENVVLFREKFNEAVASSGCGSLAPVQLIDGWLNPSDINIPLYQSQQLLRPFGMGNRRPIWALRNSRVVGKPRVMNKGLVRLNLEKDGRSFSALGFGLMPDKFPTGPADVAFELQKSYLDPNELELKILDIVPATAP